MSRSTLDLLHAILDIVQEAIALEVSKIDSGGVDSKRSSLESEKSLLSEESGSKINRTGDTASTNLLQLTSSPQLSLRVIEETPDALARLHHYTDASDSTTLKSEHTVPYDQDDSENANKRPRKP